MKYTIMRSSAAINRSALKVASAAHLRIRETRVVDDDDGGGAGMSSTGAGGFGAAGASTFIASGGSEGGGGVRGGSVGVETLW